MKYRVKIFANSVLKCRLRAVDLLHGGVRVCFESVAGGTGYATIVLWDRFPEGMIQCFDPSYMSQQDGFRMEPSWRIDIDLFIGLWEPLRHDLYIRDRKSVV